MEFQRFKHHPMVAELLKGGKRVAYGARAITEGGYQSMPKLVAPGVALLGCSAGMVNVPRIKGNHNAMLSGKAAAEAAYDAIKAERSGDELTDYETNVRDGAIGSDLKKVRNVKPLWSKYGLTASLALGGMDMWTNTLGFSLLGTLGHGKNDAESTEDASKHQPIDYPKPDGVLSFDRLTNVSFAATNHEESQPCHLRLADPDIPVKVNLPEVSEAVATGDKQEEGKPVRRILQLSADGGLYLGDERMDSMTDLFQAFDREIEKDKKSGRPTVVEIITDKQAQTGALGDVINYLTKKKVRRLEFLAVEKETGGR